MGVTPQGYDVSIGKPTRIEGTPWSYLESTSYTNARLEYVFFYDKEAAADPMNARTVQAFAGRVRKCACRSGWHSRKWTSWVGAAGAKSLPRR